MSNFFKKITSRKFILAVVGVAVGICTIFGIDGDSIKDVAGAVVTAISAVSYIITEGKIDEANAKKNAEAINKGIDAIKEQE